MSKSRPRNHTVPKVLLRGFADEQERVWVLRTEQTKWVRQHISQVAVERDFYSAEDGSAEMESWLDREIETPAGEVFKEMREAPMQWIVRNSERQIIDRFVAAQLTRTPAFRAFWAMRKASLAPGYIEKAFYEAQLELARYGLEERNEEMRSGIQAAAESMLKRNGDLTTMRHLIDVAAKALNAKEGHSVIAPLGADFACCDDPVKVIQPGELQDGRLKPRVLAHQGVGREDTFIWLPVGHFVGVWYGRMKFEVNTGLIRMLNAIVKRDAKLIVQRQPDASTTA